MKLYLASYRIPELRVLEKLIGKSVTAMRVAIIPNAKDYYSPRARAVKVGEASAYLNELSIRFKVFDLRDYSDAAILKQQLSDFDCIWVTGGNTFCLRYEMRRSGFDQVIGDLLDGGLIYVGESAGSCVAGTTLKGFETADNPNFAEEIIYQGLGLLPNIISPHAGNPMYASDTSYARELHKKNKLFLELTDYQILVVNGTSQEIITLKDATL